MNRHAAALPGLQVVGIDCHIGSQITESSPYLDALDRILDLVQAIEAAGVPLHHIDFGRGLGIDYDGDTPYAETGPIELGNGDTILYASQLIPDEKTAGDVTATFKAKQFPNGPETSYGPYTMASPTSVRFCGRQVKVRYEGARLALWHVGVPRLDVSGGGKR